MDIAIAVAIELGKIKRILFGLSDKQDPDSFRGLSESQREEFLARKGDQLVDFFEYITWYEKPAYRQGRGEIRLTKPRPPII